MNEENLIARLQEYIIPKMKPPATRGRPHGLSNEQLIKGIFYVLKRGVTWTTASELICGNSSKRSTLNRRFNELVEDGIITNVYNDVIKQYMNENEISDLIIDSTDIINGNCTKDELAVSFKLHKQSCRLSIISTIDKIPIAYRTDPARQPDSDLGYKLAKDVLINDKKIHNLSGDKGYQMTKYKRSHLLKNNKIRMVVPKKTKAKRKSTKKPKRKSRAERVRHSKQMKDALGKRIGIEHVNSIVHRSFKRLHIIYDKTMETFNGFIELAFVCIIIHNCT